VVSGTFTRKSLSALSREITTIDDGDERRSGMTYSTHQSMTTRTSETTWHWVTALFAVAGIVAMAIGAFMAFGPEDGILRTFGWTWNVADLSTLWAPFLMIGGGMAAALSMGVETTRVTLAGIVAIVVGVFLLF
jgi:uncharacterized protein (DUF2062 family)